MTPAMIYFYVALSALVIASLVVRARTAAQVSLSLAAAALASLPASLGRYHGVQLGLFGIDAVLLGALAWIALTRTAAWPTAAAALQLITVLGHLAEITEVGVSPSAYAIMTQWTAWPSLAVLAAGIWLDRRAGRTF